MVNRWTELDLRTDPHAFEHAGDPADMIDALTFLGEQRPVWHADALCRSNTTHASFFPARGQSLEPAKALCECCPVMLECLGYALRSTEPLHGIWGGTSERERKRLRSHLRARLPRSHVIVSSGYWEHRRQRAA